MKTFNLRKEDVKRHWWLIDARGKVLGRVASKAASILRGKHKPTYQPDVDCGDFVVIINTKEIRVTGNKLRDKVYKFHTNYPGGLKERSLGDILNNNPNQLLMLAIKRMLPKNRLGHRMLKRVKLYEGEFHNHIAQNPIKLEF